MAQVYIGGDHNGFELKSQIIDYLESMDIDVKDMGNTQMDEDDDYPDYGEKVAEAVSKDPDSTGILICGSSHGVCITANKTKGIRAAEAQTPEDAKKAREDVNGNVVCVSGWKTTLHEAQQIINAWLETPFSKADRHHRRLEKLKAIEDKNFV